MLALVINLPVGIVREAGIAPLRWLATAYGVHSGAYVAERGGAGNLHRRVEWSVCLTAAKPAADQEQP